jgi:hypothetical protein
MNPSQKIAWFMLIVLFLATAAFLVLYKLTGHPLASIAGFSLMGLIGFSPLFLEKKKGQVLIDERDKEINRKAMLAGYGVFWLYYVATFTIIPLVRGFEAIPIHIWALTFWFGFIVMMAARSVAVLVLYRRDSEKSGPFLESFRDMADLQKNAWIGLIVLIFVLTPFLWFFPVGEQNIVTNIIGATFLFTFASTFFVMRRSWRTVEVDRDERVILRRADIVGLSGLGIAFFLGGSGLTILHISGGSVTLDMIFYIGFCAFATGLLAQPVSILAQYTCLGKSGNRTLPEKHPAE